MSDMRRDMAGTVVLIGVMPLIAAGAVLGWLAYWVRGGFQAGHERARVVYESTEDTDLHRRVRAIHERRD